MARFNIHGDAKDIHCIVFDKDGTLIDLHLLWGAMAERWVAAITTSVSRPDLTTILYQTIGYDWQLGRVIADGPLAVTTLSKLAIVLATALYQHGIDWHRALTVCEAVLFSAENQRPTSQMLRPLYQDGLLHQLHSLGIHLAILTSDDRAGTIETIRLLGIEDLFAAVGCADDPVPNKPDPAGILRISSRVKVPPANMLMVGDSLGDMATGRNAKVAACIGIGDASRFGSKADLVFESVDALINLLNEDVLAVDQST